MESVFGGFPSYHISTQTDSSSFVGCALSDDSSIIGKFRVPPPPIISSITPSAESAETPSPLGLASMLSERKNLRCKTPLVSATAGSSSLQDLINDAFLLFIQSRYAS